jgi:hypothetical protein
MRRIFWKSAIHLQGKWREAKSLITGPQGVPK